jgi:hypothetical protein
MHLHRSNLALFANLALLPLLLLAALPASAAPAAPAAPNAPTVPKLLFPAHNSEGTNARPEFTWTPVTGATAYEIEVAADYNFATIVHPLTRVEGATTFTPAKPLHPAQRFWHVRVIGPDGKPGPRSAAFVENLKPDPNAAATPSATAPNPGNTPQLLAPAHNSEGTSA